MSATTATTWRVALGDVNGDLLLDAVFANRDDFDRVCLGNGFGGFSACTDLDTNSESIGIALGDLDDDGDLDIVIAKSDESSLLGVANRVCVGDGTGSFFCSDVSADTERSFNVALGLVDGDANLDAVFGNFGEDNSVCFGDGLGGFSSCAVVTGAGAQTTESLTLGDVDNDGDLDAVFANFFGIHPSQVCLGDGTGDFPTCTDLAADPGNTSDVALGDLDRDGNLDLALGSSSPVDSAICLGDGTGAFTTCSSLNVSFVRGLEMAEIDRDGNLDLVLATFDLDGGWVCLGDGTGGFSSCSPVGMPTFRSTDVAVGSFIGTLQNGLIGHWSFDIDARDDSGSGHDGTFGGGASITSDAKIGAGALDVRGLDGFVDLETIAFADQTDCSFSFWVSVQSFPAGFGAAIFAPDLPRAPVVNLQSASGRAEIGLSLNPTGIPTDSSIPADDSWVHVAFTHDSATGTVTPYFNGLPESTFTGPSGIQCGSSIESTIGAWDSDGDGTPESRFHDGRIDDLRIYSRVLSPAEVRTLADLPIFADGFESGDTSAWSVQVP